MGKIRAVTHFQTFHRWSDKRTLTTIYLTTNSLDIQHYLD